MTRPATVIAGTLAAIVLLFGAYMGSYFAMLDGVYNLHAEDGRPVFIRAPGYRGSVVDDPRYDALDVRVQLLRPAHYIDRLIRPNQWANAPMDFTPEDWVTELDKSPFQK